MTSSEFLTVPEIAGMLKVHRITVQRWCKSGYLPSSKIGKEYRVRREDFEDWFSGNSTAKDINTEVSTEEVSQ